VSARVRGILGVRVGGAGVRVHIDDADVVIDVVRPRRLAGAAGLCGLRGIRGLAALVTGLRGASATIRVRTGGVTLLTAGRGMTRVTPFGMLLADLAVVANRTRISRPNAGAGR
jgi:hypothetical protein